MVGGFSFAVELVSYLANMAGCHSFALCHPRLSLTRPVARLLVGSGRSRSGRGRGRGWAGVEVGPGRLVQRLRRVRFGRVWPRLGRGRGWGRGRVGRVGSGRIVVFALGTAMSISIAIARHKCLSERRLV